MELQLAQEALTCWQLAQLQLSECSETGLPPQAAEQSAPIDETSLPTECATHQPQGKQLWSGQPATMHISVSVFW